MTPFDLFNPISVHTHNPQHTLHPCPTSQPHDADYSCFLNLLSLRVSVALPVSYHVPFSLPWPGPAHMPHPP